MSDIPTTASLMKSLKKRIIARIEDPSTPYTKLAQYLEFRYSRFLSKQVIKKIFDHPNFQVTKFLEDPISRRYFVYFFDNEEFELLSLFNKDKISLKVRDLTELAKRYFESPYDKFTLASYEEFINLVTRPYGLILFTNEALVDLFDKFYSTTVFGFSKTDRKALFISLLKNVVNHIKKFRIEKPYTKSSFNVQLGLFLTKLCEQNSYVNGFLKEALRANSKLLTPEEKDTLNNILMASNSATAIPYQPG